MHRRVRFAVTGAVAVSLAIGVAACGSSEDDAAGEAGSQVTLRAFLPTTAEAAAKDSIAAFEAENPDIKVDAEYYESSKLGPLLLTQLQAGNAPDVFQANPGNATAAGVWPLAKNGQLMDLTGSDWESRIYPSTKQYVSWEDKVYGYPVTLSPYAVLYNTELFQELGLKVPTTPDDVLAMCMKVKDAGKVPFVQALSDVSAGLIIGHLVMGEYVYAVDPDFNQKREAGDVTFADSPQFRQSLQAIVDMNDAGCFQPGAQGTSRPQQYAMFAEGDAVMSIIAAAELPNFTTLNEDIDYGFFTLPAESPEDTVVVAFTPIALAANAKSAHPEQAKAFISFMAKEDINSEFAKAAGSVAPFEAQEGKVPPNMETNLGPLFEAGKVVGAEDAGWPSPAVFNEGYAGGMLGLFTGQKTVDDILADMDGLWDKAPGK